MTFAIGFNDFIAKGSSFCKRFCSKRR